MAELKTKPTEVNVDEFLRNVPDEGKRRDAYALLEMMKDVTGKQPVMWGSSMVGFGDYHYRYASGHEGDTFIVGFSPRKDNLTLYLMGGFDQVEDLLAALGKHKLGKGCLYIKKLADVDAEKLRAIIERAYKGLAG